MLCFFVRSFLYMTGLFFSPLVIVWLRDGGRNGILIFFQEHKGFLEC